MLTSRATAVWMRANIQQRGPLFAHPGTHLGGCRLVGDGGQLLHGTIYQTTLCAQRPEARGAGTILSRHTFCWQGGKLGGNHG